MKSEHRDYLAAEWSKDKSTAPIQGTAYETRVTLINESGLYALILSSKLPQAKDITRVFFTTTEAELIYLDDEIFEIVAASQCCSSQDSLRSYERQAETQEASPQTSAIKHQPSFDPEARYNGVLFKDIIRKYWELFNDGKEPVEGDRNALTFELAVTIRSICGYSLEKMMQVVPNYWAKKCTEGSAVHWKAGTSCLCPRSIRAGTANRSGPSCR